MYVDDKHVCPRVLESSRVHKTTQGKKGKGFPKKKELYFVIPISQFSCSLADVNVFGLLNVAR